jgi:hypothetical protein
MTDQPTARPRSCPQCRSIGPPLPLISRLPAEVLCTDPWHGPLLHRCTDQCVCPIHGTPLIYAPESGEHACQDATCVHGHGLQSGDPRTPDPRSEFVSGEVWSAQIRRVLSTYSDGGVLDGTVDAATADLTAWAVKAGNVRWWQGYNAGYEAGAHDAALLDRAGPPT